MPARAASSASASVAALAAALQAAADESVRAGQDAYFKGAIKHRGIKTPAVEAISKSFLAQCPQLDQQQLRALSVAMMREPLQARQAVERVPPWCCGCCATQGQLTGLLLHNH